MLRVIKRCLITLKNCLTRMEANLGFKRRVKFAEELGQTVGQMLIRRDPDPQECGRRCFPCMTKPGVCQRQGVVYKISCNTCRDMGKTSVYVGESGRCAFDRGLEHLKALDRGDEAV